MLVGRARAEANFNPNYGLVVKDLGVSFQGQRHVIVLWEDWKERTYLIDDLVDWSTLPKEIHPS